MKKLILFFLLGFSLPAHCQSLGEILSDPPSFDQALVSFEAEVIGEPILDGNGVWLNVSDQGINLALFLEDETQAEKISHFGSYARQGDRIRIKGRFFDLCPEHQERDVHVQSLEVADPGYIRREAVSKKKTKISLVLAIICLTLLGIYLIKEHYGKRNQLSSAKG